MKKILVTGFALLCITAMAQDKKWEGKFEQLGQTLPTPNSYRSSSGAPGPNYWQQRADYDIDVELNDETQVVTGKESITYFNNAPEPMKYLWLQLDQNNLSNGNMTDKTENSSVRDSVPTRWFPLASTTYNYEGGFKIKSVKDATGKDLPFLVNYTMMRVDLPTVLKTGEKFTFKVEWSYVEKDRLKFGERGGYEYFPEDGNYLYTEAQWFPRMCVFDDYEGWQNKQFLGQGEFALTFGNYRVRITVPSDHVVGASGVLQNAKAVLTPAQFERFETAKKTFDKPVVIVTQEEAVAKEKGTHSTKKSTWEFYAENVRDFAFATSRKFIWDAMAVKVGDKTPLAESLYPKEGNPLWGKESTMAVKNTLEIYSQRTFDYPYPVAYSVHTANQGMEYPMICFNGGRPKADGTYSQRTYEGMVGVIIHEVGHNFFPMIVNSDERQWGWMDEGLNSFLERETKRERYKVDISWGSPKGMTRYMKGDKNMMRPIMWTSDNVPGRDYGGNAYGKPAAALTLLRETVMGPELFDKAFKEYAQRWAFKQPKPADFFRTMEDASAVDLDWFWRGWFYTVDNVDVELDEVKWFKVKSDKSDLENKNVKASKGDLSASAKAKSKTTDFSQGAQEISVIDTPERFNGEFKNKINDAEVRAKLQGKNLYELTLKNKGGLVTPIIIEWTFADGTKEIEKIPAEIWRINENEVKKVFMKDKEVTNVTIDPNDDSGDTNLDDNSFPKKASGESKFDMLKKK
ncbi:MAG: M1 family metallopeptidase [Bacteroidetes bacterium]|nr:M1 family metallopeptidase [Bacteroidota bacterium]